LAWGRAKPARDGPSRDRILNPAPVTTIALVAFESPQKIRKGRFDSEQALYSNQTPPGSVAGQGYWGNVGLRHLDDGPRGKIG